MTYANIGISFQEDTLKAKAEFFAREFGLELIKGDSTNYNAILFLTENHLELQPQQGLLNSKPIWIDFNQETFRYRRLHGGSQMITRTLGIKKNHCPTIIDATGGMGRDSFLIASTGCQVTMYERHPAIAALLKDGLSRARKDPDTAEAAQRLHLVFGDSTTALTKMIQNGEKTDIVYLDPMFPQRTKSAKVKKDLQILHILVGQDPDTTTLFKLSQQVAQKRIVVKRPIKAKNITDTIPSHSIKGKTTRFDVYIAC